MSRTSLLYLALRSRIKPMKIIARSLRRRGELILNYFRAQKRLSSGVVESLTNKAKVTMRKSYGFCTALPPDHGDRTLERRPAMVISWKIA